MCRTFKSTDSGFHRQPHLRFFSAVTAPLLVAFSGSSKLGGGTPFAKELPPVSPVVSSWLRCRWK